MTTKKFHQKLPHHVPPWVEPGSPFFITICTEPRGRNQLADPGVGREVLLTVAHYHREQTWYTHLCLLMPDHVHLILSFSREREMARVLKTWKSYNRRFHGIVWQEGFFDHRLRNDAEFQEKAHYIRMNPVRARLVAGVDEWPYVWDAVHGSSLLDEQV